MKLSVEIKINPPPSEKLSPEKLNELIDGELYEFEKWFVKSQREKGNLNASGFIGVEGSILKTYVFYLATVKQ